MPLQTTFYDKIDDTSTTQRYDLGTLSIEGTKIYRYVKANAAIDAYDGVVSTALGNVDDALSSGNQAQGVAVAAIASGSYGWIQVYGPLATTLAGNALDPVYATATTGALITTSTNNSLKLGYLEAANNVFVTCMGVT